MLADQVQMGEARDVHHTRIFGIEEKGLVHVGEEAGAGADVVFQHDDRLVVGKQGGDAFGDVAFEIVILGALDDRDAVKTSIAVGRALELVEKGAHRIYRAPRTLVATAVGKDI